MRTQTVAIAFAAVFATAAVAAFSPVFVTPARAGFQVIAAADQATVTNENETAADDFKPYQLPEPVRLPNGEMVAPTAGETVVAQHSEAGILQELSIRDAAHEEHWHLSFNEDGLTVNKAEERRPDGTLKRQLETGSDQLTATRYYLDGETHFSTSTIDASDGTIRLSYSYPDGIEALSQDFDAKGRLVEEYLRDRGGNVVRSVRANFDDDGSVSIEVSYSAVRTASNQGVSGNTYSGVSGSPGTDIGNQEFTQTWTSPIGSAAPVVTVRWTEKDQTVTAEFTLTPDGGRVVSRKVVDDDHSTIDTISADGQFVVRRRVVKDDVTISDKPVAANTEPLEVPTRFLTPPPPPADPESLGLRSPR